MRDNIALGIMMLWVWAVSMWDHYLTIKLQHEIMTHEKNPLGLLLIFFITLGLYRWKKPYGLSAMLLLSLIQLYLVMYFFHTPGI